MRTPPRGAGAALLLGGALACGGAAATSGKAAPPPPAAVSADDPCSGLIGDRDAHPMSALARPAPGQAVADPEFGTLLRRITAVPPADGENAVIKPMYSTIQAWNADESKLILWHRGRGHELYDGRTYAFERVLPLVSPTDLEQVLWDPVDPDLLYYPSNYNAVPNLMRYRVSTNGSEVLRRFEFCPEDWGRLLSLGKDPSYLSWGPAERVVGLQCGNEKFLFDLAARRMLGRATVPSGNAAQPGPSGRLAYLDGRVYDRSLAVVRTLDLANPYDHSSLGRSPATGHDLYVSVVFDPPRGGSEAADAGTVVTHDMETGARRVLVGPATGFPYPPSGTHISTVAHRRPGWVAASAVGHPRAARVLDNEIVLAHVDSGQVCRVAHHRSWAGEGKWGYWAEPHVVLSPTATRILFASDWGNGDGVDTYVAELPAYAASR